MGAVSGRVKRARNKSITLHSAASYEKDIRTQDTAKMLDKAIISSQAVSSAQYDHDISAITKTQESEAYDIKGVTDFNPTSDQRKSRLKRKSFDHGTKDMHSRKASIASNSMATITKKKGGQNKKSVVKQENVEHSISSTSNRSTRLFFKKTDPNY